MSNKHTCGGCPNLKIEPLARCGYIATCGLTDGTIVPHAWDADTVTLTRVPEFCPNPDKVPSKKIAHTKYWVEVKTDGSTRKTQKWQLN